MSNLKKYFVGITIHNAFMVEASSQEDAENQVRDFDVHDTLTDADYSIAYVDEVTDDD